MKISGLISTVILAAQGASAASYSVKSLKGIEVSLCNSTGNKCLSLQSTEARHGAWSDIYTFKTAKISILENGKTRTVESQNGYLDFANNQLILRVVDKNQKRSEAVFDLTTLEETLIKNRS